jgi:hypothetical protein
VQASRRGRSPSTATTRLIQLQMQLNGFFEGNFKFHSNRYATRVVTKVMVDFSVKNSTLTPTNYPISLYILSHKSLWRLWYICRTTRLQRRFTRGWWILSLT